MPLPHVQGVEDSVQRMREAWLGAVDAAEQELRSGYMATVWKRFEKKSRDGYVAGVQCYLGFLRKHLELGVKGGPRRGATPNGARRPP